MSKLIPPPLNVAIGRVREDGRVFITQDWALYLTVGILQRLGGYNAPDLGEVAGHQMLFMDDSDSGGDDPVFIPGPAGAQGAAGQVGWMMAEEAAREPEIFMPPGVEQVYGRYTPTLTNVANLDASTAFECPWMRYGSVVMTGGKVDVDPTAAGLVQLGISLPVPSNFTSNAHCAGTAAAPQVAGQCAGIVADTTNDRAELRFTAVDLASRSMYFTLMYWIYP